jgi:peptidoglycan hydrolase-like protein with peptidoglycan-binding domain
MRGLAWVAVAIALTAAPAVYAAGDYPVASCKSWNGTITEKSGINSKSATLRGIVTKADIQEYCDRDPGGMTRNYGGKLTPEQCVLQIQNEIGRVDLATTADCNSGALIFRYGSRPPTTVQFPLGPHADNSCASGTPPLIEQFKLLCPAWATITSPTAPSGGPDSAASAPPSRSLDAIGPSFDCGTKAVAEQPLAQMICANRELAYWELSYVIAYQALREAANPDQRKAMVAEANTLVVTLNDRCDIPKSGALHRPPTDQEVSCIKALFQQEKRTLLERATGMAREEALLEPTETLAIQRALQTQSYLSRSDTIDGVFGPVTRKAISVWQRDHSIRESGFGSKWLVEQLASSSGQGNPPIAPAPAPATASAEPRDRLPLSIDRSGKTSSIRLTLSDGPDLRPQDVFEKVSGAVYVVRTADALGSAVAISERELLTNCHVLGTNTVVSIEREGAQLRAAVVSANADADRCVLSVGASADPLLKWVRVRPYADVKVGERAFTVGAPRGLELSLAEGIISSKRAVDVGRLFQTSAPISKGSSGGGLFDAQGNLLGITTFMLKDSQNLNFAIAAEEYAK